MSFFRFRNGFNQGDFVTWLGFFDIRSRVAGAAARKASDMETPLNSPLQVWAHPIYNYPTCKLFNRYGSRRIRMKNDFRNRSSKPFVLPLFKGSSGKEKERNESNDTPRPTPKTKMWPKSRFGFTRSRRPRQLQTVNKFLNGRRRNGGMGGGMGRFKPGPMSRRGCECNANKYQLIDCKRHGYSSGVVPVGQGFKPQPTILCSCPTAGPLICSVTSESYSIPETTVDDSSMLPGAQGRRRVGGVGGRGRGQQYSAYGNQYYNSYDRGYGYGPPERNRGNPRQNETGQSEYPNYDYGYSYYNYEDMYQPFQTTSYSGPSYSAPPAYGNAGKPQSNKNVSKNCFF